MQGNRLKGKHDVMETEYTTPYLSMSFFRKAGGDPYGQRIPALRLLQVRGRNNQTRHQKVKGDLFILDGKSGAVGGETRAAIPFP